MSVQKAGLGVCLGELKLVILHSPAPLSPHFSLLNGQQRPFHPRPQPGSEWPGTHSIFNWAHMVRSIMVPPQICHLPNQGEGRMLDPSHRTSCWLRFINSGVILAMPGCTIPLGFLLHRRLGDFMPPTCRGRTCTPPGSTTNAPSPSPCTGTSSSSFLLHCLPRDATVSIVIFVIWIYNFAYLFTFFFG